VEVISVVNETTISASAGLPFDIIVFPSGMGASHGLVAAIIINGESGVSTATGKQGAAQFRARLGRDRFLAR